MRLIDADDFKKFMQALCKAGAPYESVVELLDKQPTAYDVDKVVDELESFAKLTEEYNGCWIPCSDRLPEEGVDVLVWFEYFRYGEYNRLYQTMGISFTYNGEWSGFVNGSSGYRDLRIIAWRPLPEPYKERE